MPPTQSPPRVVVAADHPPTADSTSSGGPIQRGAAKTGTGARSVRRAGKRAAGGSSGGGENVDKKPPAPSPYPVGSLLNPAGPKVSALKPGSRSQSRPNGASKRPLPDTNTLLHRDPRFPSSFYDSPDPRSTVPAELLCFGGPLHREILETWIASQPSSATMKKRASALRRIAVAVASFGPQYRIAQFGSAAIGSDGDSSDLDLSIIDLDNPTGYKAPMKMGPIYNVRWLAEALRQRAEAVDVNPVVHAATPIVKFRDGPTRLEVDVNINDLGGTNNSFLIQSYCFLAPHTLRPLIHAVKRWAKARKINDPSGATGPATLSSYALNLLCISYLQSLASPPLLPNLQSLSLLARLNVPHSEIWLRSQTRFRRGVQQPTVPARCVETTFCPVLSTRGEAVPSGRESGMTKEEADEWRARNDGIDVGQLVTNFFGYYGEMFEGSWRWNSCLASPLQGGIARRDPPYDPTRTSRGASGSHQDVAAAAGEQAASSDMVVVEDESNPSWQSPKWVGTRLVIQDPFIRSKNCPQGIEHPATCERIIGEFQRAYNLLSEGKTFNDVCEQAVLKGDMQRPLRRGGWPQGGGGAKKVAGGGDGGKASPPVAQSGKVTQTVGQ